MVIIDCNHWRKKRLQVIWDQWYSNWTLQSWQFIVTTGYSMLSKCANNHQSELVGDVAVQVSVCFVPFRALTQVQDWIGADLPSSTILSQVRLGRTGRRLQFLGVGNMQACRAREWSNELIGKNWRKHFLQSKCLEPRECSASTIWHTSHTSGHVAKQLDKVEASGPHSVW